MTPYETALRLMRRRNGTTGHPDFIVAYILEESKHVRDQDPLRLSPHWRDSVQFMWRDVKDAFAPLTTAMRKFGEEASRTTKTVAKAQLEFEAKHGPIGAEGREA